MLLAWSRSFSLISVSSEHFSHTSGSLAAAKGYVVDNATRRISGRVADMAAIVTLLASASVHSLRLGYYVYQPDPT